jgi:hypothetical protein
MPPEHYEFAEKEILSQKEKLRIANELAMGPGIFAALFLSGILFLGLLLLRGYGILPTTAHSMFAANTPPSPRAVVAQRFYFDSKAARQM